MTGPEDTDETVREQARQLAADVAADPGCARVTDVLVVRRGRTLLHATAGATPVPVPVPRDLFSVTKTVLALVAGVAVGDGLVGLDDEVDRHLPSGTTGPGTTGRSVRHLLALQRGAATDGRYDLDEVAVSGAGWAARFAGAPTLEPSGTRFRYDNGAAQLLAELLHHVTGDLAAYAGERLLGPLGCTGWAWLRDPTGTPAGPAHLSLTARDLGRVGSLLCDGGRAGSDGGGAVLVDPGWVAAMRTPTSGGGPPEERPYGLGLWLEDDEVCFGAGWAGQLLLCRPRDGLVVVTQSDPAFDYGPPARDLMPAGWRAPLGLVRRHLL